MEPLLAEESSSNYEEAVAWSDWGDRLPGLCHPRRPVVAIVQETGFSQKMKAYTWPGNFLTTGLHLLPHAHRGRPAFNRQRHLLKLKLSDGKTYFYTGDIDKLPGADQYPESVILEIASARDSSKPQVRRLKDLRRKYLLVRRRWWRINWRRRRRRRHAADGREYVCPRQWIRRHIPQICRRNVYKSFKRVRRSHKTVQVVSFERWRSKSFAFGSARIEGGRAVCNSRMSQKQWMFQDTCSLRRISNTNLLSKSKSTTDATYKARYSLNVEYLP